MNHSLMSPAALDDDDKLLPFVDMLFGGRLTSILVCQECKHISRTYEDFNDLSLSIKPEDYAKERKRDKLKNFAKKFKLSTSGSEAARSSSVPASPRKSVGESIEDLPSEPRRRSVDIHEEPLHKVTSATPSGEFGADADTSMSTEETYVGSSTEQRVESKETLGSTVNSETEQADERDHLGFLEPSKPEKRLKEGDGWAKLGRKISMSVRFPANDKTNGRRSLSRGRQPEVTKSRTSLDTAASSSVSVHSTPAPIVVPGDPSSSPPAPAISPGLTASFPRSVSLSPALLAKSNISPKIAPISPPLPALKFPQLSRTSSSSVAGAKKTLSPMRVPKPSAEEAAYLRQVLADVIPTSNPLGIFKPTGLNGTTMSNTATQLLMKMGQLPGIEECLRMFTAVEVLDGENMVGCRRCWKIANGIYRPRKNLEDTDESDDESEMDEKKPLDEASTPTAGPAPAVAVATAPPSSPSASASSSIASDDMQSNSIPLETAQPLLSKDALLTSDQSKKDSSDATTRIDNSRPSIPAGMLIPTISTTAPETPGSPGSSKSRTQTPIVFKDHTGLAEVLAAPLPIRDSLRAPRISKHRRPAGYMDSADESSDNDMESDASGGTSLFSETSSLGSPNLSANVSLEELSPPTLPASTKPVAPKVNKISRPRQVIMRPAYKRYLIATPPPILVIHLKRFQQVSKGPMVSFSSGFKKLEDYVAFPETLDLAPFLAPRREDFGLGRSGKIKFKRKNENGCLYRLYAVVVHIGNMVGSHNHCWKLRLKQISHSLEGIMWHILHFRPLLLKEFLEQPRRLLLERTPQILVLNLPLHGNGHILATQWCD